MASRRQFRYSPLASEENDEDDGDEVQDLRFSYNPKALDRVPWKSIFLALFLLALGSVLLLLSFFIFTGHMEGDQSQAFGLLVLGILSFLPGMSPKAFHAPYDSRPPPFTLALPLLFDKSKAFLDVSIDGALAGCITIGLFGDAAPAAAARFAALASSSGGISYCRKEFRKIAPTYIQHAGGQSYGADADLAWRSGADLAMDGLISDWEAAAAAAGCAGVRSAAETVGIVVRDPARPSPTMRIVARNGRIVVEEEENGGGLNGTEFVIATKDSPELDAAAVVVGRVVAGMDLAA
ncbi:Peptidyl-prolyl cis-trans isomerase CYP19-4 [Apostasia shenzhenica]|uniref:Peptidyl-prolyl cis-trans isomerase n=1 Tax=Apostasia shenzhenica TaxID=1088818 RepID=A0A2I0BCV8_9ASPA|nr:Peptidyl-prolyl cis-trans isomerase CYP19-4 [Apostasia shenzhenica]